MEKQNKNTNEQNSVTHETQLTKKEAEKIELRESPFCQSNCKVCNSLNREKILELIKSGETYRNISSYLDEKLNEKISISSISRHQRNYKRALRTLILRTDIDKFDSSAETVAVHQREVLFLIRASFDQIRSHLSAGTLQLSIDELEKLTKLYYNILRDPDSADNGDVIALFQKAAGKQGFDINQGVLFQSNKKTEE